MENKIVRHIEVNGVTYDVPTIDGFDWRKIGYDDTKSNDINNIIKEDIEYSKSLTPSTAPTYVNFSNNDRLVVPPFFDMSRVTSYNMVCYGCYSVRYVSFYTDKATTIRAGFYNCRSLVKCYLTSIENLTITELAFDQCNALKELRFTRWKNQSIELRYSKYLSVDSIKYIIFHAMDVADGAVNRRLILNTTPLATWTNEVSNTIPNADDAELLGVTDWDRYKKEDGTLYTWGEIASLIKDITIA